MKMLKNLVVLSVVFLTPVYFSACASNKAQTPAAGEPASAAGGSQAKSDELKKQEADAQDKAKAEELERQRQAAASNQNAEAASQAVIDSLKTIHFDFDESEIKPEDKDNLMKNAEIIKAHPAVSVLIAGNCDERGTEEYNIALGNRRADAAKKYLVSLGVDDSKLSTTSYGFEKPVDPGHTEDAWAKNRRDDFTQK
jgi:peptidoglycan-associated lipoprotein